MPIDARLARLVEIDLPAFGEPTVQPVIPTATYEARVAAALDRAAPAGLDALVVYGDREHAANIAFLSGYDPRFEEAILVIVPGRLPTLMLGNEGWGYAELAAGRFERVLWQALSLMGQPRDRMAPLRDVLAAAGLRRGMRIGSLGWKTLGPDDHAGPGWLEVPSYLADCLREIAGGADRVVNANDILMSPKDGLRVVNDVDQLATMEFAASFASQAVRNVLFGIRPGMTELEAVRLMQLNGLPFSAHLMLSGGPRARYGLPSPSLRRLDHGDPMTMAVALQGSLTARAGFLVAEAAELPAAIGDYVERLAAPYFRAVVGWYEALRIGAPAGDLWQAVHDVIGAPFFGVTLNPGHLIHLDEWMHSPVTQGSTVPVVSGMALQADVIPATGTPWFTSNMEDGVALADAALREAFAARYPEAWSRIERRCAFMTGALGIKLAPEVLPFSNIPAYLPPFWLAPRRVMAMAGG